MIDEKALCRAMKEAYRDGGYEVAGTGEGNLLMINGRSWMAAAPQAQMPRHVLALLVVHLGSIPEGEAWTVSKTQGAQQEMLDMAMSHLDSITQLMEKSFAEVRRTGLHVNGYRVWQAESKVGEHKMPVYRYDDALVDIGGAQAEWDLHGDILCAETDREMVAVLPVAGMDETLKDALEQILLAGE